MGNADALNRTLFIADNLPVLRGIDSESIDLIATDPPFNKGVKAFEGIVTAGYDKTGQKVSYRDIWTWRDVQQEWVDRITEDHPALKEVIEAANTAGGEDMGAFLCWLAVRVLEMHRVLKPTGSMYLHVDHTAHAYVKTMMDAIFGKRNFRNEIVWHYNSGPRGQQFGKRHDTLLWYSKGRDWTFNKDSVREPYSPNINIPPSKAHYYHPDGKVMGDVWNLPILGQNDKKERTGFPTQKPLELYERIIKASSNPGDLVLDPFAGCATTAVAAERLALAENQGARRWIAIDVNAEAETVIRDRLKREVNKNMDWNKDVQVSSDPPKRTDDGEPAAAELTLVSPKPKAPRLTARQLRERLIFDDGMKCQGCGWVPHHEEYLEVDHRVPKSREGRDDIRNRVLLCSPCNGAKGNKLTLAELRERRIKEDRMSDKSWDAGWYQRTGRFG